MQKFITLTSVDDRAVFVLPEKIIGMKNEHSQNHGYSVSILLEGGHKVVVEGTIANIQEDFPEIFGTSH